MRKWKCVEYVKVDGWSIDENHKRFPIGLIFKSDDNGRNVRSKIGFDYPNGIEFLKEWYKFEEIKEDDKKVRERSIHITTDGTSTHAVLKDGKQVIKRAKVGLYHGDEYKFETGVIEVVKKLFDIVDEKKKVVDDGNFSVRCVRNDNDDCGLTIGKVYKFVDGYSNWNSGNKFPQKRENGIDRFRNIDDLNEWLDDKSYGFELIREEVKTELSRYTNSELLDEIKRRMEK